MAVAARPFQHFPGVAGQWHGGNNGTHRWLICGSSFKAKYSNSRFRIIPDVSVVRSNRWQDVRLMCSNKSSSRRPTTAITVRAVRQNRCR